MSIVNQGVLEVAAELAAKFGERAGAHEADGSFPFENYEDLKTSGFLTLSIPEEWGGPGLALGQTVRALALLGEGCASTALVTAMHIVQLGRAIELNNWPTAKLEEVLAGVVEEGYLLNNAASEPATGSPSRGGQPTTTAKLIDGQWHITGRKTYTTGSPVLHYITLTTTVEQDDQPPQVGNFLLTRDMPGLTIEPTWDSMAMRLTASHDLIIDDVIVAPENYLGPNTKSSPQMAACNASWTLPVAAVYLGIGRAAAKYALQFAKERKPNSLDQKAIVELPHIQDKIGRMELALLSAEYMLFGLADQISNPKERTNPQRLMALVGAAKNQATNQAIAATDYAFRIVGAAGMASSSPMQRYYRDGRAGLHNPPMDDASLSLLAKSVIEDA